MNVLEFKNRVASLYNIDHDRLPELTDRDWQQFRDNPPGYLVNLADRRQSEAIMREVERRQVTPPEPSRKDLEKLSRQLADNGRLIEAGWISLRLAAIPFDAPEIQIEEMRNAFMAGSHHLFSSILTILDPEAEPTEADMRRMDLINAELEAFGEELKARIRR